MSQLTCTISQDARIETLEIGQHQALCIDNFLEDPRALEAFARRSRAYEPYPGYREGKGYPGVRAPAPDQYSYTITTFLEPLIKQYFNVGQGKDIRKSMCAMSLMTVAPEQLSPLQSTPHFDASGEEHIAVLLYLCGPEHGGTAFYQHKATGLEQINPKNVERYLDTYYEELNRERPAQSYFLDESPFFKKTAMIEAKYNRMVLYKGSLLHNPYITDPDLSVSTGPHDGRLTVNTFFDF